MKRTVYFFAILVIGWMSSGYAQSNWVGINQDHRSPADVVLLHSDIQETHVQFSLHGFVKTPVVTPNGKEVVVSVDDGTMILEKGMPDLSKLVTTIIIPDLDRMEVNVVSSKYEEFTGISVAPSKGHFTRDIRPEDVPFTYGEAYDEDAFWPGTLAQLEEPFIMRDFRGQALTVFPMQYNPVTQTLRVYTDLVVEVTATGDRGEDPLERTRDVITLEPEFAQIYDRFFLNMGAATRTYPMLEGEEGSMLIIAYDAFMDAMQPFVDWKRTTGRKTEMVALSDVGATSAAIKSYVVDYYNDNDNFAHLLLVGDGPQIPAGTYSNNDSDNFYGFIVGNNQFNDIFVGRFSAETVAHVETHVQRMIEYERDLNESDTWLSTGMGIARNEGSGHHGEPDHVHMEFIRDTLLNFTYDIVHQHYEYASGFPNPTAAGISADINDGLSAINFCNHGSVTGWSVAGYNISHVNQLTNVGMLPYITSVACVNGNFVNNFCFAEAWMRATHNGEPTGAVGIMAATINQPWQPPMCGQDEMVSIKAEQSIVHGDVTKRTYGGISINGSMFMIPQYGATGINTHATWILFGDPSLMVRTAGPTPFDAVYNPVILLGTDFFDITVSDAEGALVAISYYDEVEEEVVILGTATVDGGTATVIFEDPPAEPGEVTLAITGFNKTTYLNEEIQVIPPEGPYVVFDEYIIDDSAGNNNNQADYGEYIVLDFALKNVGVEVAAQVEATLTTQSEYVTITDNYHVFGDIADDSSSMESGAFAFQVEELIPDNHNVLFTVHMHDDEGNQWESNFTVRIYSPQFTISDFWVDDSEHGDGNGRLDPGEIADIVVTYTNQGGAPAMAPESWFFAANPYLTLYDDGFEHPVIPAGESVDVAYTVEAHEATMEGTFVDVHFTIQDGHTFESGQELVIGQTPEIVIGDGNQLSNQYPFYNYYRANRSQMIYLADEMGAGDKTITEVAFNIIQASSSHNQLPNFVIRMMHTDQATLSGFANTSNAHEVFTADPYTMPLTAGWETWELDEYFEYDGESNLLVEIVWGRLPNWTSNYYRVASTDMGSNMVAYGFSDQVDVPNYSGSSSVRPNIHFSFAADETDEVQDVTFLVQDNHGLLLENAAVTVGSMTHHTAQDGTTLFTLLPGNYSYSASKEPYEDALGGFEVADTETTVEIVMTTGEIIPGDANCDGVVDVLDVVTIVNYFQGHNPQPFCFDNADVNEDGVIDILDVMATINIFTSNRAQPFPDLKSDDAHIYLHQGGIRLDSDGTVSGLQFEVTGELAYLLQMVSETNSHSLHTSVVDKSTVRAMLLSMENEPFPAGEVEIVGFDDVQGDLEWSGALAGNMNADPVTLHKHNDMPTGIEEPLSSMDYSIYPNPARDVLWVDVNNDSGTSLTIELITIHGSRVERHTVADQGRTSVSFNLEALTSGLYMVRFTNRDDVITEKIVVQ